MQSTECRSAICICWINDRTLCVCEPIVRESLAELERRRKPAVNIKSNKFSIVSVDITKTKRSATEQLQCYTAPCK